MTISNKSEKYKRYEEVGQETGLKSSNSQYGAEATEEGTKGGGLCRWSKGNQDNGLMWRPPDEKRE
ncbi:MAG: hypothetical protein KBG20_18160, partial [Caldilineaceae bacterium]|nr:hypothetical protein [Caldilineaceae bacterium]MBP8124260.1 hypothetical protein [Caldilineaceae bacterium]MBP9074236.1 hypothetical protein [Caldilineaceae bacterium]